MNLIRAIVRPLKLDEVRDALVATGAQGPTVSEAKGFGLRRGRTGVYRGAEYRVHFPPKVMPRIAVPDDPIDPAVDAIQATAATGRNGDGRIFVLDLTQAVRIRTGETNEAAL